MRPKLDEQTVAELLASIGAKTPTPGGGAVASIVSAIGAALGRMVVNYSVGRKKLAEHAELHEEALRTLAELEAAALDLAEADAAAYGRLNELWKLPADDERRVRAFPDAVAAAIDAPARVLGTCLGTLHLLHRLKGKVNRLLHSDLVIAAALAETGARAAACNVRVNLPLLDDADAAERLERETARRLERARKLREAIEAAEGPDAQGG